MIPSLPRRFFTSTPLRALALGASIAGAATPAGAQTTPDVSTAAAVPVAVRAAAARVALELGGGDTASFDARSLTLGLTSAAMAGASELRLAKAVGPYSGELARRSGSGERLPAATIDLVDAAGAPTMQLHLLDVVVSSYRLALAAPSGALEQQELAQQEALAGLAAQVQDARRQLAAAEELDKRKLVAQQELSRVRERAAELQQRYELAERRQALLARLREAQEPLTEEVTLRFRRLEVNAPQAGGSGSWESAPSSRRSEHGRH